MGYGVGCDGIIDFINRKVVMQRESIREKSFDVESLFNNEMDLYFQITKTGNQIPESRGKIFQVLASNRGSGLSHQPRGSQS